MCLLQGRDDLLRGVAETVRGNDIQPGLGENRLALIDVGALQTHHQGDVDVELLGRRHDALGNGVAAHDAAEDVDQDALDVGIGEDDLEGDGDPLGGGAAPHVQEIGRI